MAQTVTKQTISLSLDEQTSDGSRVYHVIEVRKSQYDSFKTITGHQLLLFIELMDRYPSPGAALDLLHVNLPEEDDADATH